MPSSTETSKHPDRALAAQIRQLASAARSASDTMGELSTERKNAWLLRSAERLESARDAIMEANAQDVAAAAAFLVSDRSAYTSGCILTIDGGLASRSH